MGRDVRVKNLAFLHLKYFDNIVVVKNTNDSSFYNKTPTVILQKHTKDTMENERKKEIELKMANWAKKMEAQSSECQMLVEKLNDTAKEVHEYKALAKAERERASQLEELLNKQHLVKTNNLIVDSPVSSNVNEKEICL